MNPAESTVTEHANHIPAACLLADMFDDRVDVWQIRGRLTAIFDVLHEPFGIEALRCRHLLKARDLRNDNLVRVFEGGHQLLLEYIPPGGIGARFKDGP